MAFPSYGFTFLTFLSTVCFAFVPNQDCLYLYLVYQDDIYFFVHDG